MDVIFEARNINFHYEKQPIIDNLSFTLRRNEFVALVGPSGIGKSTLLKLCAGLLTPISGSFFYEGRPSVGSHESAEQTAVNFSAVFMPQTDALFPWRNARDNIAIPLELRGVSKAEARQAANAKMIQFGLEMYADYAPHQLSGGLRQRIAFLRTMMSDAELLLLDEPFSSLDGLTRIQVRQWLNDVLQVQPKTVLMITHDLEEALLLADRIFVWRRDAEQTWTVLQDIHERPRTADWVFQPECIRLKKQLMEMMM